MRMAQQAKYKQAKNKQVNNHIVKKICLIVLSSTITASLAYAASGTGSTSYGSTSYGTNAAANETSSGNYNTSIGENANASNTIGDINTMAGYNAGTANTTSDNTFIGAFSGDGIADYLDNDSNTTRLPIQQGHAPMQTSLGLTLQLGSFVQASQGAGFTRCRQSICQLYHGRFG